MATLKPGLDPITQSISADSLGGPGPIAFDESLLTALDVKRNEVIDYIRLRLADGIVDVELDQEHYFLAIKQALIKYRQRSQNAVEESYAFLNLLPETQEYILPSEIITVKQVFRRGIGSVTGTTASQFEPFASGYLNTYMLQAGRIGGLANYELFAQYQEQSMKMFGGYMNFTWNPTTKKITLIRKMPSTGHSYIRLTSMTANAQTVGSTISIVTEDAWDVQVGSSLAISNCKVAGYNGYYQIRTVDGLSKTVTITAVNQLQDTTVTTFNLRSTQVWSPSTDVPSESVLLHTYNYKPDAMLLNDHMAYPWLQDYAYSFAKRILGEARSKFAQIAGPQGGTTLNGDALKSEALAEMEQLENDLKNYVDGGQPLTWIIG
ncbi:hypothetical protein UFOVP1636_231 [uncultured Caudovirales phage]|uniref:Neck protein n=1 Tax=uncultured Caudovirales phage TaxID=2100421 RepID=A0A6J5T1B0_9CAUD|nr:hypothetical protein UFOVP1636_231 [uncultured Caudovirales phage]